MKPLQPEGTGKMNTAIEKTLNGWIVFSVSIKRTVKLHGITGTCFCWGLLLLSLLTIQTNQAHARITADASVQQSVMTIGQSNTYTITLRNTPNVPNIDPPRATGLAFGNNISTRSSTSIINGVSAIETSISWTFQAERPGIYTIPGRTLQVQGQAVAIDALQIEVREMPPEMRKRFFLRWELPEGPYYVGQAIPAKLQLYVRSDINAGLGSQPEGSSEQFIRNEIAGGPHQSQVRVDGQIYTLVEWESVITPIRSGTGDLPVHLVLVYETGQLQRDFFGARPIQNQIRLVTEAHAWQIKDLPQTGRPAGFSGAVGNFTVEMNLSETVVWVGDPITATLSIKGTGNFERIRAPDFVAMDGWRVYPPRSQMQEQEVPYRGVKTFEYILTAGSEQVTQVPALAFSWFDPQTAAWREVTLDPHPVTVRRNPAAASQGLTASDGSIFNQLTVSGELQPIATALGKPGTLQGIWQQPSFWIVNGTFGSAFALALLAMVRKERSQRNPYLQVRSEAAKKARDFATAAIKSARHNEDMAFYTQARQSLRHFLAYLDPQSHNADSLTWDDLERILIKFDFETSTLKQMQGLFERKDAIQFAGWKPSPEALKDDQQLFETLLNQIVTRKEFR
jgi:hypothetical protein